jgi:hypothetical protein
VAKYFHTLNDNKPHYDDLFTAKKAKPFEGVVYSFWNENYTGERNSKKERHGNGSVEWNLDVTGQWRFEEWAKDCFFEQDHKEYDYDDKLNPDRKLRDIKIKFKGIWENDLPNGKGKMYLNDKLFCEGNWRGGSLHGHAKFEISFYTANFGVYNNHIGHPGYPKWDTKKEYIKEMKTDKKLGSFDGEFEYGLANGYGELIVNNGFSYKGNWLNGYPYGSGLKIYEDGREEFGEFGILNEGTLHLMTEYVGETTGVFLKGTRRFSNGDNENVDRRTLFQKIKSNI